MFQCGIISLSWYAFHIMLLFRHAGFYDQGAFIFPMIRLRLTDPDTWFCDHGAFFFPCQTASALPGFIIGALIVYAFIR